MHNMATDSNKRKDLSVEEIVKMIQQIENGKNETDMCRKFCLLNYSIQTI
jgi:hypothetical protein